MASKKRAQWSRQKAEFNASLSGAGKMDDAFAREKAREARRSEAHDIAHRRRACESKNRYASRVEAEAAIQDCARWGTPGLSCYHCDFCGGWHLTSHPWD